MKRHYRRTPGALDWMPTACAAIVALGLLAMAVAGPSEAQGPPAAERGIPLRG